MAFCTAINCMDGRVQLPVIKYLQKRFYAEYVDIISDPGPNKILADQKNPAAVGSILSRLAVSVDQHRSKGLAVVGHHSCAGNPAYKKEQLDQIENQLFFLQTQYPGLDIIGLWVNEQWQVEEMTSG